jgi:hypothetical protein
MPVKSRTRYETEKSEAFSRLHSAIQEIVVAADQCRLRLPNEAGSLRRSQPVKWLSSGRLSWLRYPDFSVAVAEASRCNLNEYNPLLQKYWVFKLVKQRGALVIVQGVT